MSSSSNTLKKLSISYASSILSSCERSIHTTSPSSDDCNSPEKSYVLYKGIPNSGCLHLCTNASYQLIWDYLLLNLSPRELLEREHSPSSIWPPGKAAPDQE